MVCGRSEQKNEGGEHKEDTQFWSPEQPKRQPQKPIAKTEDDFAKKKQKKMTEYKNKTLLEETIPKNSATKKQEGQGTKPENSGKKQKLNK